MTVITIDRVGNIERVSATNISGWYINSVDNKPALLRLYADSVFILEFTAGEERPDVVAGGFNKAECGFRIDLPEAVRNAVSLEIIDALDNVAVWKIDFGRRNVLNDLLQGQLPTADSIKPLQPVPQENADVRILFDVSDLVYYIGHHDNLTGIQRVQSSVIQAMVRHKVMPQSNIGFIAFDASLGKFQIIDEKSFLTLLVDMSLPVANRTVTFDRNKARVGNLFARGDLKITPAAGKNMAVVLLGAAWVIPDYVNVILNLKRRYGIRFVPTFHDLIPIYARETCDQGTAEVFKVFLDQILRHVDVGLCVSENTAKDLARYCAENALLTPPTIVTQNGSSLEEFFPASGQDEDVDSIEYLTREPYVLFVSTIEGRKNHAYAFQIWEKLLKAGVDMPRLVCVGRLGWRSEGFLQSLLRTDNLNGHIQIVEDISDAELKTLYKRSLFTIYPSQYEGWGLPIGESLYYGKPCVLTSTSSLPEVAGDLGIYIPSDNLESAAHVVQELIENPTRLAEITKKVEANFTPVTWSEVATKVVEGCRAALSKPIANITPEWQLGREYTFRQLRIETAGRMGQQMLDSFLEANRQVLLNGLVSTQDKILGLESRNGQWYSPEPWGCWSNGFRAGLCAVLNLSELDDTESLCLFAAFRVPGQYVPCTLTLSVGQQVLPGEAAIRAAETIHRWLVPIKLLRSRSKPLSGGLYEIDFELELRGVTAASQDALRTVDTRKLGIGLESLLITKETDYVRRLNVLEKLVF